jgi:high affinity sulfate transporter 1
LLQAALVNLLRLPGIADLRKYRADWLPSDVLAGVSVASIQVPTAIAYAVLAGFSAETGLYASVLPLIAYALLGSSRQLIVGPDSATCAMIAATLLPLAGHDAHRYADYSVVLALMVGAFSILGGFARLGFIADFLSRPILTGFLNGVGLSIIAGQMGKLLGLTIQSNNFIGQLGEVASRLGETHVLTAALGVGLMLFLIVLKRVAPRIPGPLAGVVIGGLIVASFDLTARGVRVLGVVASGLPPLGIPSVDPHDLSSLAIGALGIALVSYCSAMLTARSFAARNHYDLDANQDFIALGVANLSAGLSRGFVVSGADSRTAISEAAGAKSRLAGVVSAAATALVVLFFTGPLRYIPNPALAAVLIMAGIGLIDVATLRRLRTIDRFEFRLAVATTLGVLVAGVLPGIVVAVALAIARLLSLAARPTDAVLGEIPGQDVYLNVAEHPEAMTLPGLIIYRFDAGPLFFNAGYLKQRIRAVIAAAPARPAWFLFSAEAASVMDFTGAEALREICEELDALDITFAVARPRGRFDLMLGRTGLDARIGADHIFPSVRSGVTAFRAATAAVN